jgi:acetyl esterase/lipase
VHKGVPLVGDLYVPDAPGPHALVVSVHGGGWERGSRASYRNWGHYLAAHGYALFATDRRRFASHEVAYPGVVNDLQAAVRFARGEAKRLDVDPARIALMGGSSGGYLAALAGLLGDAEFPRDHDDDPHGSLSCAVKAVIAVYGVYDLLAEWNFEQVVRPADRVTEKLFGIPLIDDRKLYFEASPIAYATRSRNNVAFLLAWGTDDDVVDEKLHSEPFARALAQANFNLRTVILPHAQHYWLSDPIDQERSHSGFLAPRLLQFLGQNL